MSGGRRGGGSSSNSSNDWRGCGEWCGVVLDVG